MVLLSDKDNSIEHKYSNSSSESNPYYLARLQTGLINQIEESSRPAGAVGRDLCQQNTKIKFMFHQHDPGGGKVRRLGGELLGIRVKEI